MERIYVCCPSPSSKNKNKESHIANVYYCASITVQVIGSERGTEGESFSDSAR